jgi:spore coat protein JC
MVAYWFPYKNVHPYAVVAEQKARVTYDNILRLSDDPDVNDVIKFLREREIVHFQRFGEAFQSM